ncbi:FAD-binding domain-containing protein [Phormidium sp. CCY1219]|uniref:FAD-binding domain-containing protein n=1 Tax=Phormidium sp. CCY1219 TaxID=2886104 RepID=UPI002D1F7079|nr:FAD-binding domain-containing protein [Phormidium sp. CCY1219]MEB3829918.1 deoxyribodipyrimidine photo-lyase [Phormidium sp. CCY1219]
MSETIIFWHRRDLRLSDNVGLAKARQKTAHLVGVFCLDPNILDRDDVAPARVKYMLGCLRELQESYAQAGSQLLILNDEPSQAIATLARALQAKAVYWNLDVEPYSQQRDKTVCDALEESGIEVQTFWDRLLHEPAEIRTGSGTPYSVYTPFWKNWNRHQKAEPKPRVKDMIPLSEEQQQAAVESGAIALPTLDELGFSWDNELLLEPGETAAREKLEEFCDRAIYEYDELRNFPAVDGTSGLSAALKFGAVGIRRVWAQTCTAWEQCRSDETRKSVQTWRQELAWREFYQHALYHYPALAEGPYRDLWKDFPWENNQEHFQAWCEGRTGYPIVDAAMRQLNQTGWMHNRCRMIVASFLTKDLIINWQWGEKYFMQKLYDGDLAANNGGWQWSASSGMDPKPLRIFNPTTQGQKFDPEGEYIRQWVPELRSLDTEVLMSGKIPPSDRQQCEYPAPIVDHKQQQRRFKALYQQQKNLS